MNKIIKAFTILVVMACNTTMMKASIESSSSPIVMSYAGGGYILGGTTRPHRAPAYGFECPTKAYVDGTSYALSLDNTTEKYLAEYYIYDSDENIVQSGIIHGETNGTISLTGLDQNCYYVLKIEIEGNVYVGHFSL